MDRSHYPALASSNDIYLDASAMMPAHQKVITAVTQSLSDGLGFPGKGAHSWTTRGAQVTARVRQSIAELIGAEARDIVVGHSGTDVLRTMLAALHHTGRFTQVIFSPEDHTSVVDAVAAYDWQPVPLSYRADGTYDLTGLDSVTDPAHCVVVVSQLHHVYGSHNSVADIRTRLPGACIIVDASQSIARMTINADRLGCDALFFSGHKLSGVTGVGIGYCSPLFRGIVRMSFVEPSSIPVHALVAAGAAAGLVKHADPAAIARQLETLSRHTLRRLTQFGSFVTMSKGPAWNESRCLLNGILSFSLADTDSREVAMLLDMQGIEVRAGDHCVNPAQVEQDVLRVSLYTYNTEHDIDRLADVVAEIV